MKATSKSGCKCAVRATGATAEPQDTSIAPSCQKPSSVLHSKCLNKENVDWQRDKTIVTEGFCRNVGCAVSFLHLLL